MYKSVTFLAVLVLLAVAMGQSSSNKRAYVAGKFAVELDGVLSALGSCAGGGTTSDVVEDPVGPDGIVHKHIAGVKYQDITVTCGMGMSKGFYEWMKASFDKGNVRKNGAVIAADFNYKDQGRVTFTNALITEVGMPALDAASKDAAKMTIKLSPESTRQGEATGLEVPRASVQKKWTPANFRLKIDGLEKPCSRVSKIDGFTIKQKLIQDAAGGVTTAFEVPNLVITFPELDSKDFYDWHEDFVIKGNNGDDKEKGGTLEYLTPDLQTVLFTLTFHNLGIFKLTPEKTEAGSETIRRVKAEMYCEDMKFNYTPAVLAQ